MRKIPYVMRYLLKLSAPSPHMKCEQHELSKCEQIPSINVKWCFILSLPPRNQFGTAKPICPLLTTLGTQSPGTIRISPISSKLIQLMICSFFLSTVSSLQYPLLSLPYTFMMCDVRVSWKADDRAPSSSAFCQLSIALSIRLPYPHYCYLFTIDNITLLMRQA